MSGCAASLQPVRLLGQKLTCSIGFCRRFGMGSNARRFMARHLAPRVCTSTPDDRTMLTAALEWLERAQDVCGQTGVATLFAPGAGWDVPYPETSGYIIATYLAHARLHQSPRHIDLARRIGDWECAIQAPSGGIVSRPGQPATRVFNTGQVILGWCALYEETTDRRYLDAAARAGQYLANLQEVDGSWIRDTYCGARTYHARVDWALIRLGQILNEPRFIDAALRNLDWVCRQQQSTGWFAHCGFHDQDPITHTLIYTLRGMLESHLHAGGVLQNTQLLDRCVTAADRLCGWLEAPPAQFPNTMFPTSFRSDWTSSDRHSCLTGNSQAAVFLYRLFQITGTARYATYASRLVDGVASTVDFETPIPELRGAVAGSYPIYTGYMAGCFPNWATKFFADALLMRMGHNTGVQVKA